MKMNTFCPSVLAFFMVCTQLSFAQVVVYEENFDDLIVGQSVGSQTTELQPISGVLGGSDDPLVSNYHAQSDSNSMMILNQDDVYYDFGGVTSGSYSVEFAIYLEQDGYFNIQHQKESGWACDVFLTASNEILYQDQPSTSSATVVGTYLNDTWFTFRFEIDIDADVIELYKNDTLLHTSTFSNAVVGPTSSKLDIIDFYGLAGFQGVNSSQFYVDDFKVTNNNETVGLDHSTKTIDVSLHPNPSHSTLHLNCDQTITEIIIYNLQGQEIQRIANDEKSFDLDVTQLETGAYLIATKLIDGSQVKQKFLVNH